MKHIVFLLIVLFLLPFQAIGGGTNGAQVKMLGKEFQVNSEIVGGQQPVSIAMKDDSYFEIVWLSRINWSTSYYIQKYDFNGNPLGGETLVYSYTPPSIAKSSDGSFVQAWITQDYSQIPPAATVHYSKFDTVTGQTYSGEVITLYNNGDNNYPFYPTAGLSSNGSFVITWTIPFQGIFARSYDPYGNPRGEAFRANSDDYDYKSNSTVAMASDGSFVVTWHQALTRDNRLSIYDIFARRFDGNGQPIGRDFRVNTTTDSYQYNPLIAMAPNGDFVITWTSYNQDGDSWGVYAQRFEPTGHH